LPSSGNAAALGAGSLLHSAPVAAPTEIALEFGLCRPLAIDKLLS
jgi:hypothetical protein